MAYIDRGDADMETTLAELQVAYQGVLKDVSRQMNKPYNEMVDMFAGVINV